MGYRLAHSLTSWSGWFRNANHSEYRSQWILYGLWCFGSCIQHFRQVIHRANCSLSFYPLKFWPSNYSYTNVYRSCVASKRSVTHPLLSLLPFSVTVLLQYAWLLAPNCPIRDSPLFVPFLCAWGLQFAHQVGRIVLAHVTSSPFPYWNWLWVWFALGALDANLPYINMWVYSRVLAAIFLIWSFFLWNQETLSFKCLTSVPVHSFMLPLE